MKKRYLAGFVLLLIAAGIAGAVAMHILHNDTIDTKEVQLSGYKHLSVKVDGRKEISDEALEEAVESQLETEGVFEKVTSEKVKKGDIVNITFQGYLDEEQQKADLSEKDYDLEIGSHTFMGGFEEKLIGQKPGKEIRFSLDIPENDMNQTIAGHKVTFHVTINYIKKAYTKDTLTDEIVQKATSYHDTEDLFASVRKELEQKEDSEYQKRCRKAIWKELYKRAEIKEYKKEYLEEEYQKFDESYETHAKELNISAMEFISEYYGYSLKEYSELKKEQCHQFVKKRMITEAIAAKEKIKADTYEELLKEVERMLIRETEFTDK